MIARLKSQKKIKGIAIADYRFIQEAGYGSASGAETNYSVPVKPQSSKPKSKHKPDEVVDLKKEIAKTVDPKEVLDTDSDTMARGKLLDLS